MVDVNHEMKVMREETFGPVAPIMAVTSLDEAIEYANDSPYGLVAYVYTRDLAKAITAAERLEYGTVGINNVSGGEVAFPYGGWKESGIGVENSSHAVDEYLQMKHIRIDIGRDNGCLRRSFVWRWSVEDLMSPFTIELDFQRGVLHPCNNIIQRHLSDMRGMYLDEAATEEAIEGGDPLLYEVYQYDVPFETGQLLVVTSVIQPGKVGDEYYMTKGHFHEKEDRAEVYVGLRGQGYLLLETKGENSKPSP